KRELPRELHGNADRKQPQKGQPLPALVLPQVIEDAEKIPCKQHERHVAVIALRLPPDGDGGEAAPEGGGKHGRGDPPDKDEERPFDGAAVFSHPHPEQHEVGDAVAHAHPEEHPKEGRRERRCRDRYRGWKRRGAPPPAPQAEMSEMPPALSYIFLTV